MDESRYTDTALRKRLYKKILKGTKGGNANEWSARKAQLLAKEYKEKGGGYKKSESKEQKSLVNWTKQNWMTSETYKRKKEGKSEEVKSKGTKRYLPEKAWEKLTKKEIEKTNKAKAKGYKAGKQFVSQPKQIAKKTSKYR